MIKRPQDGEFPPFAAGYVKLVGDEPILDILERQQQSTYGFFGGLPAEMADYAYADDKWTIRQVLGHMADTERVFAYRALVFSRESRELPGFDQDLYMQHANFGKRSLVDLAQEFKVIRESSLYLLRSVTDEQSLQKGIASGYPVSVRGLAYLIAGHELHHLKILKERYLG
jgi:uncharacterized damage-inducible protein DinB